MFTSPIQLLYDNADPNIIINQVSIDQRINLHISFTLNSIVYA